jgi:hypothetical protein
MMQTLGERITLADALQKQLGLELNLGKAPLPVVAPQAPPVPDCHLKPSPVLPEDSAWSWAAKDPTK